MPSDAGLSNAGDDGRAADVLAHVIEKEDFARMDIVGQFNLGFIVTRRCKPVRGGKADGTDGVMDDLFVVD